MDYLVKKRFLHPESCGKWLNVSQMAISDGLSPVENNLEVKADVKLTSSSHVQPRKPTILYQKKNDQQVGGGDCTLLHCFCETPPRVLH